MTNEKLKLTIPWEEIEHGAQEQIQTALDMDCMKSLAIMPDVHQGYDLPIGGVALLDGHIWPGAVGYDIGCGMCHVNTGLRIADVRPLHSVVETIRARVPVGFSPLATPTTKFNKFPNGSKIAAVSDAVRYKASLQLGTLGGGNHFIEIGENSKGEIGVTIHSGSRRPGWLIGDFYMRMTGGPVPIGSDMAQAYLKDMQWALDFALSNRARMMEICLQALAANRSTMSKMVNENHNHAVVTREGVLHRKGATPADEGQVGIIPANMRDGVWVTVGLGNKAFLSSASHGAGRKLGRKAAECTLNPVEFAKQMEGILTPDLGDLLDEAPGAYKDINGVLAAQEGILIEVIDHFKPLAVIKG